VAFWVRFRAELFPNSPDTVGQAVFPWPEFKSVGIKNKGFIENTILGSTGRSREIRGGDWPHLAGRSALAGYFSGKIKPAYCAFIAEMKNTGDKSSETAMVSKAEARSAA
jgi:hypothetical protein